MLKFKFLRPKKKKQKGMAVLESIPILFMLVLVFNFSLGFFGAIHSGILNSIGSYNYAFETFRYRSNLMYFRPGVDNKNYKLSLNRVHGVVKDGTEADADEDKTSWPTTIRDITFNSVQTSLNEKYTGRSIASSVDRRYAGRTDKSNVWFATSEYTPDGTATIQTPRIWIKTVYGICVSADCTRDGQKDRQGE
jgi:hypothetical protein